MNFLDEIIESQSLLKINSKIISELKIKTTLSVDEKKNLKDLIADNNPSNPSVIGIAFTSLINGEYYLNKCSEKLQIISSNLDIYSKEVREMFLPLLNKYNYLHTFVSDRSFNKFNRQLLNFDIDKNLQIKSIEDYSYVWLNSLAVKLSEIDEGYNTSTKYIKLLYEFHTDLINCIEGKYLAELNGQLLDFNSKCILLLFKINRRLKNTEKDIIFQNYNDSNEVELFNKIKTSTKYKEIIDKINKVYPDETNSNSLESAFSIDNFDEFLKMTEEYENLKIFDVHLFIKTIKKSNYQFSDDEKRRVKNRLNQLLLIFQGKLSQNNLEEHEYIKKANDIAYKSIINLISNTNFIFSTKNLSAKVYSELSYDTLIDYHDSIKKEYNFSKEFEAIELPNFILYKSYIENVKETLTLIRTKSKFNILNESEEDINSLFSELFTDVFDKLSSFKEKVTYSQKHRLMPIYVEIEECIQNEIFIDSQYVLPPNYSFLLSLYDDMWDKLKDLERINSYIIPSNIKNSLNYLTSELKNSQFSIITIIGLYASFITFVLANVNILPFLITYSMGAVFAFMLVFGIILFFFVGTLKLLFSSKSSFEIKVPSLPLKVPYFLIWIVSAIVLVLFGLNYLDNFSKTAFNKGLGKYLIETAQNKKTINDTCSIFVDTSCEKK